MASTDDTLDDNVESSAGDTNDLDIIDTHDLDDSSAPTVVKRGRGRPRKSIPSLSTSDSANDGMEVSSPDDASPEGSTLDILNQKQQGSPGGDDKRGKASTIGRCESCMTDDVRIYKYGKLKVCKECEGLMRAATGSNRRHSMTNPATIATLPNTNKTASSSENVATENVLSIEGDQHTPLQEPPTSSRRSSQDSDPIVQSGSNVVVKQEGSSESPSSPTSATSPSHASPGTVDSAPRRRGRKPKARLEIEHQTDEVSSSANNTSENSPTSNTTAHTQIHPESSTSTVKKRGRKPKSTNSDQEPTTTAEILQTNIPEPSNPAGDHTPLEPTKDSGNTSKSTQRGSNKFQTTGAFLTRTASRLLGGQAVTGVDSNIHGYAYQRAVKVLNIDGTWYYGSMIGLENGKIKVHFDGWGPEWDEWLASDSKRMKTLNADEILEREALLRTLEDEGLAGPSSNGSSSVTASTKAATKAITTVPATRTATTAPATRTSTKATPAISSKTSNKKSSVSGSTISAKKPKGDQPKRTSAKRRISPSEQDESAIGQDSEKAPADRTPKRAKKPSKAERLEMLFEQSEDLPLPEPVTPQTVVQASSSTEGSTGTSGKGLTFRSLTKPGVVQDRRLMTPADVRALLDNVHVGMKVQARDKSKQWYESTILQIKSHRLLIQYDGWSDIFNEWMDVGSERLIFPDWKSPNSGEQSRSSSEPRSARAGSAERKRVREIKPKVQRAKSATPLSNVTLPKSPREPSPLTSMAMETSPVIDPAPQQAPQEQQMPQTQAPPTERPTLHISFDDFSSSSDELSDPLSSPTLSEELDDIDDFGDDIKDEGADDGKIDTESLSKPEGEGGEKEATPAPTPYYSLGNPIQLGLEPPEIMEYDYQDEEQAILRIIHRVLDTGLIKNRVVETPPEEPFNQPRATKKKKKPSLSSSQCNEGNVEGGSNREDGGSGDDEDDGDDNHPRTNTKTRDRFVALLEARQQDKGNQSSGISQVARPTVKKDTQELQETRQLAMRNMCSTPLVRFVRQVIYNDADRTAALNNTFESRKAKLVKALSGRKAAKQRHLGPLSKRILGLSNASNILGVTFNEAGYIETPTLLKIKNGLKNMHKITKKKRGRKPLKAMEDPNLSHDENQKDGPGTFQNLRSLTRAKKRNRVLVEDHITFLRRTMVPGTRIRARDRQMDWLIAVIRDVKNSRVLVHYEGYHEYFNEWIDINSERLRYDSTLEQNPPEAAAATAAAAAAMEQSGLEEGAMVFNTDYGGNVDNGDTIHQNGPATNSRQKLDSQGVTPTESEWAPTPATTGVDDVDDSLSSEDGVAQVNCVQCQVKISQFRIYCMYCEAEAKVKESGREPFNLCLWCFSNAFPEQHDHPRSSFATKVIVGPRGVRPVKGGIITRFEKDLLDTEYKETKPDAETLRAAQFQAMMGLEGDQGFVYLDQWKDRKVCAFCNDDGTTKDHFIGPNPFLLASTNRYGGTKKRHFWAHDACARHSPEVIQGKDGTWYNVSMAMRRGRTVKCASCKEKGATIGCFDPKCGRSFHVPCTGKPMSHFEDGVIFWCPQHERDLLQRDAYDETFSCDKCSKVLGVNPWQTCVKCSDDYFHTFDLCQNCFSSDQIYHEHGKEDFKITSLEMIYKEQLEKEAAAQALEQDETAATKKKTVSYKPKMRSLSRMVCSYCWSATSAKWRKGYNGVLMCEDCFLAGPLNEVPMQPPICIEDVTQLQDQIASGLVQPETAGITSRGVGKYATSAEDYSHSPYLTRTAVSSVRFDHSSSQAVYLDSYGPAENQLYSLPIDTTYYDIPGRAPRWATHSGTDYHGTWLPQTVRRAVTKFTNPNEKILSNFLGRGTDAIECFLLGRCCTAVDINPAAITLSIRNCSFAIPPDGTFKAEHRPTILQGDSRKLTGPLFENESFDHVLSHPPYKDCVAYSTHIDGDLSRFGNAAEFQREMNGVIRETYRLLKMGRRCTLGIGDNREHCFYIPVSFQLIRQYINEGFELEELIVKRQRYCAMFGLGTYLCVQFDFLCFTHEFIATLRKIPKEQIDTMILEPDPKLLNDVHITSTTRAIPSCPIERKSVVMGSVWTFKPTEEYDFPTLCVSRMVERFGRNDANWEDYKLSFKVEDSPGPSPSPEEDKTDQWTEHVVDILPPVEEEMVSYERDRLNQIQENNRMLLALGLITELSETSDDIGHQIKIAKDTPCYPPPAPTALRMIAHIPNSVLKSHQVPAYRMAIMHLAIEALEKLPVTGVFVVGTQDIRRPDDGKLIPLSMLVLEDIVRVVGEDCLKLKELIEAVPDGYQKDRRKVTCQAEYEEEICTPADQSITKHLPIVHACYLVFTKVKEKDQGKEGNLEKEDRAENEAEKEDVVEGVDGVENEREKENESMEVAVSSDQ
ncbi:hypothetical protein BGZ80_011319 [Entomortierella chlamydospora]|uniref:PHD-type domain-containing protein n=1 Tax=Entomortierella chlamydospora TaxID=101097 RepID=A0A9P6SZ78_9FUNG|nr:hypothetical protein BGZ80_011319 [Entomortierella chlamydospora]